MTSAGLGAGWHVKFSFTCGFNQNTTQTACSQATFFCTRKIEIKTQPTSQSLYGSAGELSSWKCQAVPLGSVTFYFLDDFGNIPVDIPLARSYEHGFLKTI